MTYKNREKAPSDEEGPRWDISGRQETYEGAVALKETIEINSDHLNVKIHKVKGQFVIKTREKPPEDIPSDTRPKPRNKKRRKKRKKL